MELPIRFPDEKQVLREEGEAFRRLTPAERMAAIGQMFAFGMRLLCQSPQRQEALRWQQQDEEEWQRIQKALMSRHANHISPHAG